MSEGLTVGDRLGRYTLDEDLGQGALGPVFSGTDGRNDRKVLVRTIGPGLIDDRGLWRKLREAAQRVRRLDHPVPAQVVDVVDTPQAKAIIEERIEGHSLGQELDHRGGQLPLHRAYAVFVRIADAVQAAHDTDLPHWRLNPQAVMISRTDNKERVRITGFGVGLALTESGASATKDMPVHLAYYLAPDQAHRGMSPSPQSDVYALGVMLYEALTGYVPFGGDDVYAVVRGHLMDPPPPPRSLVPDLPWHVEAVVMRALAKHPDDRLKSPRELALYLRGCASGAVVRTGELSERSITSVPVDASEPSIDEAPTVPNDGSPLATNGRAGVRVRREGPPPSPPPSPPAVTPLPLPPPPSLPLAPRAADMDEDEDVPTQVRTLKDFETAAAAEETVDALDLLTGWQPDGEGHDDHEDTNPGMAIIDVDDLILIEAPSDLESAAEPADVVASATVPTPAAAAPAVAAPSASKPVEREPVELPQGVPNPSYLALLAPRG